MALVHHTALSCLNSGCSSFASLRNAPSAAHPQFSKKLSNAKKHDMLERASHISDDRVVAVGGQGRLKNHPPDTTMQFFRKCLTSILFILVSGDLILGLIHMWESARLVLEEMLPDIG